MCRSLDELSLLELSEYYSRRNKLIFGDARDKVKKELEEIDKIRARIRNCIRESVRGNLPSSSNIDDGTSSNAPPRPLLSIRLPPIERTERDPKVLSKKKKKKSKSKKDGKEGPKQNGNGQSGKNTLGRDLVEHNGDLRKVNENPTIEAQTIEQKVTQIKEFQEKDKQNGDGQEESKHVKQQPVANKVSP